MKKAWKRMAILPLTAACLMNLVACNSNTDNASAETTTAVAETAASETNTSEAASAESETTVVETPAAELSEDELWAQEPMYGQTITITYGGGNCTGASYVALLLGFYDELGLDVQVLRSGSTDAMNAVATGQAELVTSHISQMTVPTVNGLELYFAGGAMTGCQSLYVLADSDYQTTSDLVGKKVNIASGYGSQDHNIVLRFMARDGLHADDYSFVVTDTSAAIQAMQNGELDASLLPDSFAYQFLENGTLRVIRSLTWDDDFKNEPCCVIALNREFVDNNPITAKKLMHAVAKASSWIDSHTEESVQLMLDSAMISGDNIDLLEYLQGSYDWTVSTSQVEKTLINVIDDYKTLGLIDNTLDTNETLDSLWRPALTDEELEAAWDEGASFDASGIEISPIN